MSRRAKGEGCIRKRKDGRWEGLYTVGYNVRTGKIVRKSVYGKTQAEVARYLKVSPQTFNTWMQGLALPRMGKVQALADYFRISKADLIDEHTPEEIAADAEQSLVDQYTLDPKIREFVLYAGRIEPGEARDKYVGAVLLALRAMCEAGKK